MLLAKALKTAALIVGAVALVATGVGAIGVGAIGLTAATLTTIGTIAGVAASLMSLGAASLAGRPPPGTVAGNPTKFTIEKQSGIPYTMGRTLVGGRVAHRQYYGAKNVYESWVSILSLGPVKSVGPLLIDKLTAVALSGTAALGAYAGYMWLDTQIGATPEARALAGPAGAIPGWDPTSKLSGLAADLWTLKWDKEGKVFPTGVPVRGRVVEGVLVYDPRQDSTYPGGSGACRLGDEETYVYSENPACHAVTWAFGRYQNDVLVAGGGLAASGIDMATFAEWANVCDANGWKVGGTVFTEADNSWDVLRMIAQAGGGECVPVGARLAAIFSAPRVSIGTVTSNDVCGPVDVPATAASRIRRNTIIPKVRLEAQGWEMTPLDPVSVPEYVALDGASRPRELDFPLVQQADQGAELALYAMLNDRELDGISITAKIYALGYRPGDCLTIDIPEANLIGRDVILREREIDAASMAVTLVCRSETAEKHSFALGRSGVPPRTPDLSNPGVDLSAPSSADWQLVGATLSRDSLEVPALVITGAADDRALDAVVFDYRPYIAGAAEDVNWTGASIEPATVRRRDILGVLDRTQYEVGIRYRVRGSLSRRLVLGPVETSGSVVTYPDGTPIDDLKPAEPGATNGSPNGSYVGDRLAEEVNRLADLNGLNILGQILRGDALTALIDARTVLDGKQVGVVIGEVKAASEAANAVFAQNFAYLGARNGADNGWVLNGDSIEITGAGFASRSLTALTAEVDGHRADITDMQEILFDPSGVTLRSVNILDLDGNITGTVNTLTGERSDYVIYAENFRVVNPNGGQPITPFRITPDGTVTVTTLAYETLVPLFAGTYSQLNPAAGFQKFPGGYIRQWGQYRQQLTNEAAVRINFPVPFAALMGVSAIAFNADNSSFKDAWMQSTGDRDVAGATFKAQSATSDNRTIDGFDWEAWGTYAD